MAEPSLQDLKNKDEAVEIVWRAFELRPEPVPTLDPQGEYLTRVWLDAVYPLAERLGMKMRLPPVQPRSRRAHEAAQWAGAQGRFDDYNAGLFRFFFERGEDISDTEVLTRLAAELEFDAEALRFSLQSREYEARVLEDERAAEELGITGVPAFVADRSAILFGVQTTAALAELVTPVRQAKKSEGVNLQHLPISIERREQE